MAMLNAGFAAVEAKVVVPAENAMAIDRASASGIVTYAKIRKVVDLVMGTGVKRCKIRLMLGSVAADVAGPAPCSGTFAS